MPGISRKKTASLSIAGVTQPFLKWAGGKTQLLADILPQLPERMKTYYEPFIGGGAVFFALAAEHRFDRAVIADRNPWLIELYKTVRDDVGTLIKTLARHAEHAKDEDYYYEVRARDTAPMTPAERSARILFLNKTCYNGLYRVNRKGQFNVPFGRYANPRVCNEEVLTAASRALQRVEIKNADFEIVSQQAKRGDAIYFDPPYVPVSATSSFTAYDSHVFGKADHERLASTFKACVSRGAAAVLSNSDTPETRALYEDLDVRTVNASRAINSVAGKRGRITELLVVGARREKAHDTRVLQAL
jgi:DNA adenine methylase